jgi:hypothetical protein
MFQHSSEILAVLTNHGLNTFGAGIQRQVISSLNTLTTIIAEATEQAKGWKLDANRANQDANKANGEKAKAREGQRLAKLEVNNLLTSTKNQLVDATNGWKTSNGEAAMAREEERLAKEEVSNLKAGSVGCGCGRAK